MPKEGGGVAETVRRGLLSASKALPPWLLYDEEGCALYERITRLPEYYLTRAEREIFETRGASIVALAREGDVDIACAEIGAGSATKTEILLAGIVSAQGKCTYLACDIAAEELQRAARRIGDHLPTVDVRVHAGAHIDAGPALAALTERQTLLFIGSSIGNYSDVDGANLLRAMRSFLREDAVLLLGTDLRKDPEVLLQAYDDSGGVTAAFSKNLLVRLNRELEANFDLDAFRHVAEWNAATSNIEIYLESLSRQEVRLGTLDEVAPFREGERIHIETSAKYDDARIDRLLEASGFHRRASFEDAEGRFAVHVAAVG